MAMLLAGAACVSHSARAHGGEEDAGDDGRFVAPEQALMKQVGVDQKMDAQLPLDMPFRDDAGNDVKLGRYFTDKPVMMMMISYTCAQLCTVETEVLATNLNGISFLPGRQFEIVVASIDPRDKTKDAVKARDNFLKQYKRPGVGVGVHFLTGDEASIKALAKSVGYRYAWNKTTKEYAHPDAVMLMTPQGKVAQYFLQLKYYDKDLRRGIIGASQSRIGTPLDYLALSCWHRNPTTGQYTLNILGVLKLAGVATLLVMALGIALMVSNDKRGKRGSGTKAVGTA